MPLVKHPAHGNKHVTDAEVPALVEKGWVKWPRSKDEKALGDGSAAAYWRAKFEAEVSKGDSEDLDHENPDGEPVKRRGRPPKA